MSEEIPSPPSTPEGPQGPKSERSEIVPQPEIPTQNLPIADRIQGLAASHSRSLGGEVAAQLFAGLVHQLSTDLQDAKRDLRESREHAGELSAGLSKAQIQIAVQDTELAQLSRMKNFSNIGIFLGTTTAGIGIDLVRIAKPIGIGLISVGLCLITVSWFASPRAKIMILQDINELALLGVYERGVPNQERIILRAVEATNLGQYVLLLGVAVSQGMAVPIRDNLFWFGDASLEKGDWLFVYTAPGKARTFPIPNTEEKLYMLYWGRKQVMLDNPIIIPVLVRLDAVVVEDNKSLLKS